MLYVSAHITCEKNIAPSIADKTKQDNYLSPARVYTWNDAFVNLYETSTNPYVRRPIIIGEMTRSVSVTFERAVDENGSSYVKRKGSLVILGESSHVFDPSRFYDIELGYDQVTSGSFGNKVVIKVKDITLLETPGYSDSLMYVKNTINDPEKVDGPEISIYDQVPSSVLCTRFDWEAKRSVISTRK